MLEAASRIAFANKDFKIFYKGVITIIQITKEESQKMRERFPYVSITITSRQTSHKKYYMEETSAYVKYLKKMRDEEIKYGRKH